MRFLFIIWAFLTLGQLLADEIKHDVVAKKEQTFSIQLGSYKKSDDAEAEYNKVKLLKINATIDIVKIDDTTWYRVLVGRFISKLEAKNYISSSPDFFKDREWIISPIGKNLVIFKP